MDKFRNTYHIPSARWQNWDYRRAGTYFITICTGNREHYFGEIADGNMHLSGAGILFDVFRGISLFFDSYPGIHSNYFIAGTQQRVNIHFLNFYSEAQQGR